MSSIAPELAPLHDVASRFLASGGSAIVREFGTGIINKTYLVAPDEGPGPFLLQRLNTHVFPRPDLVMGNMGAVCAHLASKAATAPGAGRWEIPHVLRTQEGADHWQAGDGSFWRALRYIDRSRTIDAVTQPVEAREVGRALGTFHALVSDMPAGSLADTLPGFHVTPGYLARYDALAPAAAPTPDEADCHAFVAAARPWVAVLEEARARGELRERPIHGDPKVNNVLFEAYAEHAIAMIDWDTVKPGLVQYDVGDGLRSACNPAGENADWRRVTFDLALAGGFLAGYLGEARAFFDDADFAHVPAAARLIAFELGLRFFTDHLEGDRYFGVTHRGHNLERALVQFALARKVDAAMDDLRRLVDGLR